MFTILGAFAKFRKTIIGFDMPVRSQGTIWFPPGGGSRSSIFETFSAIIEKTLSFIKI
jgi:hypothetical protein